MRTARHPRRRPAHLGRGDTGAIAIVTALVISSVLLVTSALVVDFGNAFARERALQTAADLAAVAGAQELPAIAAARTAAINSLCNASNENQVMGWPATTCSSTTWASDGSEANGEIAFYGADDDADGTYESTEQDTTGNATAIRVLTPLATVEFGLGSVAGAQNVTVNRAATARIGTPVGAGDVPFFLLSTDVGGFCVRDAANTGGGFTPATPPTPTPAPNAQTLTVTTNPQPITAVQAGTTVITFTVSPGPLPVAVNQIRPFVNGDQVNTFTRVNNTTITFVAPAGYPPFVDIPVWLTFGNGPNLRITNAATIRYFSLDPCERESSNRGYLDEPRFDATSQTIERNIKFGLDHTMVPWTVYPPTNSPPTPGVECANQTTGTAYASSNVPLPIVNCALLKSGQTGGAAKAGFFVTDATGPARMTKDGCEGVQADITSGAYTGVDGNSLFQSAFVNAETGATLAQIEAAIRAGAPATGSLVGSISSKVFTCPRLSVMPVVEPPTDSNGAPVIPNGRAAFPVVTLKYVWLDDDSYRGFEWQGSNLRAIRGWVIDPAYLPSTVAGSVPGVGDWLGPGMPKAALLVRDVADPPT